MALNIAVPLSGVGGLSPILPLDMDCWENIKILVSPIGSESSGVSSLDSEEAKIQQQKPTEPSPTTKPDTISGDNEKPTTQDSPDMKITYNGRNILDLKYNIETNSNTWQFQSAKLPENNMVMFLANRSQYHRLGANGLTPEYRLMQCPCCDFQYPINRAAGYFCQTSLNVSPTTSAMTFSNAFRSGNNNTSSSSTSAAAANVGFNNHHHSDRNQNTLLQLPVETIFKNSNSTTSSLYSTPVPMSGPNQNQNSNQNISKYTPPNCINHNNPNLTANTTAINNLTSLLNSLYSASSLNQSNNHIVNYPNTSNSYFQSNQNNASNANSFYNGGGGPNSNNALTANNNNNAQSYGMYKYF